MLPAGRDLLDLCDAVRDAPPASRAISILAACAAIGPGEAAALDVGSFHARMLDLCQARYGDILPARVRCAACGARADLELAMAALRQPPSRGDAVREAGGVAFRLPCAADLLDLPDDEAAARRTLLARCIVSGPAEMTDEALEAVAAAIEDAAPQADVIVAVACGACGETTEAMLDPAVFLWQSLARRADALADDVHALATAYHWSETDILALPATRRRRYLDRIGA